MAQIRLSPPAVVDVGTLSQMHETAVAILARTGVAVHHPAVREELLRRPGFAEEAGRLRIAPERVADWLRDTRSRQSAAPGPTPEVSPRYSYAVLEYASWVVTEDGRGLRPMLRGDVVEATKLLEVLRSRGVRPAVPGVPQDLPPALRPVEQYLIGAEYSSAGGATQSVTDLPTALVIREMDRVCGKGFSWSVWLPNPLTFGGSTVDILWHFGHELQHVGVGSMPLMGFSGPCDPLAVTTFSLAENLGGAAIIHALLPEIPVTIFPHPQPGDMRTGTMMLGTPESELLELIRRDLLAYYGVRFNTKMMNTSASLPDAQAQIDRMLSAVMGVVGGFDAFHAVGTLGIDEVWSSGQLLLDLEMVAAADHVARGPETAPGLELDRLPDVVDEVVRAGMSFAAHETTAGGFRRQYVLPRVLRRMDRAQWIAAAKPDTVQEAEHEARRLVQDYAFEPPQALLCELRSISDRGKHTLGAH
jgi:trimethylamine--corrinoid protein Co-methyltransferase